MTPEQIHNLIYMAAANGDDEYVAILQERLCKS